MLSRRSALAATFGALLSACGRSAEDESVAEPGLIRIAILKSVEADGDEGRWSTVFAGLPAAAGLTAKTASASSAAALVEAMHRRRVDLAVMSAASALGAVRRADGEVFARLTSAAPSDTALMVVGSRSLLTLDRILKCDRKLLLGVADGGESTALSAADAFLFAADGVAPSHCFRSIHAASAPTVLGDLSARKIDVAFLEADQASGAAAGGVRALWRSPPIPSPALVWRRDLDPAVKEKLRQYILTYGQAGAAQKQALADLRLVGFAPADNSHLLMEREMDAAHAWLEAKAGGDKAKADQAKSALDELSAERHDLEARTGAPAGVQ